MARTPYPPYDDKPINPYGKIGNGTNYGICRPSGASVDHSMFGFLSSTDAWFRRRDVASLTPWGIGGAADGAYDGVIFRWMDYYAFSDVQPWSSGPWNAPGMGDGPAFVAKHGVAGINGVAEAIETSDGGARQVPMSVKQWLSLIWLKAAVAHRAGLTSETYRDVLAFMHHREFSKRSNPWPNNDKDCPFPRIYTYTNQYLDAVVKLMRFFEGKTDDLNTLVFHFAGLVIDMRHVGRMRDGIPTPSPTPDPKPAPEKGWIAGASARAKKEVLAREGHGTTWPVVLVIRSGEFVKLVSDSVREANGMDWVDISTVGGSGWVPKQDFELAGEATKPTVPIFHEFEKPRLFTVGPGGATLRQWGHRSAAIWDNFKSGHKILMDGYYDDGEEVEGSQVWLVQDDDPRGRVHISGVVERI